MTAITVEGQGALVDDLRALIDGQLTNLPDFGTHVLLLLANADVMGVCDRIRGSAASAIIVIVPEALSPLARHLVTAAIAPLAIEQAPGQRIAAIVMHEGAALADVAQAALFLATAAAVTGQLLEIRAMPATRDSVAL